jgi:signal transduction histidine kinase
LTSHQETKHKVEAFRLGANDYVTKPAQPEELLARVYSQLHLKQAIGDALAARMRLVRASRLQVVEQLAAAVAHEVNTPAQYVSDNLHYIRKVFASAAPVLAAVKTWVHQGDGDAGAAHGALRQQWTTELEHQLAELPEAVGSALEGIQKVATIIDELREFAGPGTRDRAYVDLNRAVQNIVLVSGAVWREHAELTLDLQPELPAVECISGDLRQAIMVLLVNAAERVREARSKTSRMQRIAVGTRSIEAGVEVRVSDSGASVPGELRESMFDVSFTADQADTPAGQGLSYAHHVVAEEHGGRLTCEESALGGVCVRLWVPCS